MSFYEFLVQARPRFLCLEARLSPGCSGGEAQEMRMNGACILKDQVSGTRKMPLTRKVRVERARRKCKLRPPTMAPLPAPVCLLAW